MPKNRFIQCPVCLKYLVMKSSPLACVWAHWNAIQDKEHTQDALNLATAALRTSRGLSEEEKDAEIDAAIAKRAGVSAMVVPKPSGEAPASTIKRRRTAPDDNEGWRPVLGGGANPDVVNQESQAIAHAQSDLEAAEELRSAIVAADDPRPPASFGPEWVRRDPPVPKSRITTYVNDEQEAFLKLHPMVWYQVKIYQSKTGPTGQSWKKIVALSLEKRIELITRCQDRHALIFARYIGEPDGS